MVRISFVKYFALVGASGCFVYFLLVILDKQHRKVPFEEDRSRSIDIKYVLLWTPFDLKLDRGRSEFIINDCEYASCYITDNKDHFVELTQFDAILFDGTHASRMEECDLPTSRNVTQKYIFFSTKPVNSVCNQIFDEYYNLTWTYRLDSDIRFNAYTIYDSEGFVGPAKDITWKQNLTINDAIKAEFENKNKDVAWIVSDCITQSRRERFAEQVAAELSLSNRSVDVFGACGRRCGRKCRKRVRNYHFYLSFEDVFAEDYVTDVLTGLDAGAVPIVYGAANYSRFLPPGSYLDGRQLGHRRLAETIETSIRNKTLYYEFHKWRSHYYIKETKRKNVCHLCAALKDSNTKGKSNKEFRQWWNGSNNKCSKFITPSRCL